MITGVDLSDLDRVMREDLATFAERCFAELNPGVAFTSGWHIELVAKLMGSVRISGARVIVNLPPRHLKSLLGSTALPAWLLGHNPSQQIICASYGTELAYKLSRDCRRIMESAWYRRLFPGTRLERGAVNELTTTRGGFRLATSIDGVLTGRGADIIIIDDPIKPDGALSAVIRNGVNEWFDNTLYSRLNDKRHGRILIIMQRLHEDDLTGYVSARGGWEHLVLPAIAEEPLELTFDTPLGSVTARRQVGEALHPGREPLATLEEIKRNLGEYHFAAQYQQRPAPRDGGDVKRAWFRSYAPSELPTKFDHVVQSWDTANKPTELSDYSVCTTWGMAQGRYYLLHVLRKKLDYPSLKRAVREQAELHKATAVLIEDKASGTQLIQELRHETPLGVRPYTPKAGLDKRMRLHAQTAVIENGMVYLPAAASWLDAYLHELTTFPASKHDDQVDSTSQALDWIKTTGREPGLLAYYTRVLEDHEREQQARLAPASVPRFTNMRCVE